MGGHTEVSAGAALGIGFVFLNVSKAFMRVVRTEGNDIAHMLDGVHDLGTAFQIQIILTLLSVIIGTALSLTQTVGG